MIISIVRYDWNYYKTFYENTEWVSVYICHNFFSDGVSNWFILDIAVIVITSWHENIFHITYPSGDIHREPVM